MSQAVNFLALFSCFILLKLGLHVGICCPAIVYYWLSDVWILKQKSPNWVLLSFLLLSSFLPIKGQNPVLPHAGFLGNSTIICFKCKKIFSAYGRRKDLWKVLQRCLYFIDLLIYLSSLEGKSLNLEQVMIFPTFCSDKIMLS